MTHDATWLTRAPSRVIQVGDLVLRPYRVEDVDELSRAIGENIAHLSQWMEWIAEEPLSREKRLEIVRLWGVEWDEMRNFTYAIFEGDRLIGSTGLHLREEAGSMEIGYWVDHRRIGRGVATAVTRAQLEEAFSIEEVEVVRIAHAPGNAASARIPEKLGFTRVASEGNVVWELWRPGASSTPGR